MKLRHRKVGKVCRGFKYIGGGGGAGCRANTLKENSHWSVLMDTYPLQRVYAKEI